MRVRLRIDGGFAYLPGLARPVIVDTDALDAAAAAELRRLCANIDVAASAPPATGLPATRDARRYRIEIDASDGRRELIATDPVSDPALAALIAFVQRYRDPTSKG